jgi:signal transduction histidine kinase/ActR/RegA family two-component response regulator
MSDARVEGEGRASRRAGSQPDAKLLLSVVRTFTYLSAMFTVLFWIPGVTEDPLFSSAMALGALAMMVIIRAVARRGHPWAGGLILVSLFLAITLAGVVAYGFQACDLGALPVVVLFAGLLCGWRAAVVFAGVALVATAAVLGMYLRGVLEPVAQATPVSNFTLTVGLVVLVAAFLSLSLKQLHEAIAAAEASADAARRSERRLADVVRELREVHHLESLGRLAGGVAHDFNNLLQVIIGNAEILGVSRDQTPAAKRSIAQIMSASERAAGLIRQLLAFARRQVLEPRVLVLDAVLGEVEPLLRRLLPEDVELRVSAGAGEARVRADPSQLEQVIINLVVNARDAMPAGGRLTLETTHVDVDGGYVARHPEIAPGPYAALIVTDTGVGMGPETLERIFEPFFTTKADGTGTGLGLATVHGVVRQHGGHIIVYSEPDRGASFKVLLPLCEEVEAVRQAPACPGQVTARGETVLVVDDDEGVRNALGLVLQTVGYTVLHAADGAGALAAAEAHSGPIHLLITDVVMPRMGGRALAAALAERRPGLRVLFVSGYAENAIVHGGELEPGLDFLAKPTAPGVLLQKIRAILDRDAA